MTLDSDVARLARTPPFTFLPREAVQLIAFSGEKQTLKPDQILFRCGEDAEDSYFLISGSLELDAGGRAPVRIVRAGALVSESALFAPASRRNDAKALEATTVIRIPRATFRRVLAEFPSAAEAIRRALAEKTRRLVDGLDARAVLLKTAGQPRSNA